MSEPSRAQRTLRLIAIASTLPTVTLAGGLLGALVDRWLGSSPLGVLGFGALGFGTAVLQLLRSSRPSADDTPPHPPS